MPLVFSSITAVFFPIMTEKNGQDTKNSTLLQDVT